MEGTVEVEVLRAANSVIWERDFLRPSPPLPRVEPQEASSKRRR